MAEVNVIILNWNGERHLRTFLSSVVESAPSWARVVVADNGSTDASEQYVQEAFPGVLFVPLGENYGYAGGYNRALEHPDIPAAEFSLFLNSDVYTPEGWLEPLRAFMEAHGDVACAAPKILSWIDKDLKGRDTFEYAGAAGGFIDGLGYPFCRGRILSTVEPDTGQYDTTRDVFWASGACLMVRTAVFRELGGFDSDFFAHMEEIDFCWRASLAGWRVCCVAESRVYHLGGGTLSSGSPRKLYLNYRNNLFMLYKNLTMLSLPFVMPLRMLADGASAMVYLLTGNTEAFRAVWRAHIDFYKAHEGLRVKRSAVRAMRVRRVPNIYKGSVLLRYLFRRKFGRMV